PQVLSFVEALVLRATVGEVKRVIVGYLGDPRSSTPRGIETADQMPAVEDAILVQVVANLDGGLHARIEKPFVWIALDSTSRTAVDVDCREERQSPGSAHYYAIVVVL